MARNKADQLSVGVKLLIDLVNIKKFGLAKEQGKRYGWKKERDKHQSYLLDIISALKNVLNDCHCDKGAKKFKIDAIVLKAPDNTIDKVYCCGVQSHNSKEPFKNLSKLTDHENDYDSLVFVYVGEDMASKLKRVKPATKQRLADSRQFSPDIICISGTDADNVTCKTLSELLAEAGIVNRRSPISRKQVIDKIDEINNSLEKPILLNEREKPLFTDEIWYSLGNDKDYLSIKNFGIQTILDMLKDKDVNIVNKGVLACKTINSLLSESK